MTNHLTDLAAGHLADPTTGRARAHQLVGTARWCGTSGAKGRAYLRASNTKEVN